MLKKLFKITLPISLSLFLLGCDDDESRGREIIFVEDISELDGDWLFTQQLVTQNENSQVYKSSVRSETIKISSAGNAENRSTLSRCDASDITIELQKNTIFQVLEIGVDADGDGNVDLDGSGQPITEEALSQLFVLSGPYSMQQPFTSSCDTQEKVDNTGCTLNHSSNGFDDLVLLNNDNFGSFDLDTFGTTNDPTEINATETLDVTCFEVFVEQETDGEGVTRSIAKAKNANYQLDLRNETIVDFDSVTNDFVETEKAWIHRLEPTAAGKFWQWRSAEELAPNPEHNRSEDTGSIITNSAATNISIDVENLDNNEIEEDNAGVTSTVIYNATGSGTLIFELFEIE